MKKIILSTIILLTSAICFAQFPQKRIITNNQTNAVFEGGAQTMLGFINGVYTDTTAANAGYIDFYNGAQIWTRSDRNFWLRDSVLNMWIRIAKFSDIPTGGVNSGAAKKAAYYASAGTTISDVTGVEYNNTGTLAKFSPQATTDVGIEIKTISSQIADALQINSSTGSGGDLVRINKDGELIFAGASDAGDYQLQSTKTIYTSVGFGATYFYGQSASGGAIQLIDVAGVQRLLSAGGLSIYSTADISFIANTNERMHLWSNGLRVGGSGSSASAKLHIDAGTSTAGDAPLKLTAGTNLATTEAGAIEYDGTHLYFTATNAGTRYQLDQQGGASNLSWNTSTHAVDISGGGTSATIPDASSSTRGLVNSTTQGFGGDKYFDNIHIIDGNGSSTPKLYMESYFGGSNSIRFKNMDSLMWIMANGAKYAWHGTNDVPDFIIQRYDTLEVYKGIDLSISYKNGLIRAEKGALKLATQFTPSGSSDATWENKTITADDTYLYYKNSAGIWVKTAWGGFAGSGGATLSKGVFDLSPTATDTMDVWQTPVAITVTSLKSILRGSSSPSVTYNIGFGTNIQSPTAVFTSNITCTSITTGCSDASGFNDATIPAGSFIWIYTTAKSGTVNSIAFTINYTED